MSDPRSTFDRVLNLSAFDGDSRAALRAMHAHFAQDLPDCTLALLLVRGQVAGRCRLAGLIGPDGTEHVPNLDPAGERVTLPLFEDELASRIVAASVPHVLALEPVKRGQPLAQALFAPAAVLAIPLANSGELTHWLVFASSLASRFARVHLEQLLLHVNLAASLIIRPIALRSLARQSERQRREIESLADIQKLLLPDNPQIRGLDYAWHWQPAETAAGDYFEMSNLTPYAPADFHPTGNDVWGVIVADVSGHGAAAAMEAVQFDAIMRTYRGEGPAPPAGALSYANRYFFSRRNRGHFMTVFAVLYRPDTRTLSYLSAGHPPMLLRRRGALPGSADVSNLGESDQIPLGVLRDYEYSNNEITLEPGDLLVLYTDGITEARDRHDRMFGAERLRELVASGPDSPRALCDSIVAEVTAHQGRPIGDDDQTLIVLRITF
ncbi:MAG TPA: PP2C family protein-serine/threonine phosphatase [Rhodanobacteraceae bacterium]|nr:PP2C family protein-serine/threonine phosphatase [Rhodanobacteraceae bacterium]